MADAETPRQQPREIVVAVGQDGRYAVDRKGLEAGTVDALAAALQAAAAGRNDAVVIISADAAASHQAVINVSCLKTNCSLSAAVPLRESAQKLLLKRTTAGQLISMPLPL